MRSWRRRRSCRRRLWRSCRAGDICVEKNEKLKLSQFGAQQNGRQQTLTTMPLFLSPPAPPPPPPPPPLMPLPPAPYLPLVCPLLPCDSGRKHGNSAPRKPPRRSPPHPLPPLPLPAPACLRNAPAALAAISSCTRATISLSPCFFAQSSALRPRLSFALRLAPALSSSCANR